jgi:hypothetical protein
MSKPTRRDLIHFLEDIADRMKNRMLSDQEEKLVSQFYIDHSYYTSNTCNNSLDSEKDLRKYITMGWYIYQQLNQS